MNPSDIKHSLVAIPVSEHVSFSDEETLLETFKFFVISRGCYQPLKFLPIFISLKNIPLYEVIPSLNKDYE